MKIELLRANDNTLKDKIKENLEWAHTFNMGVAYATITAYNSLKGNFETFLRNNGRIKALFDIEKFITDTKILKELSTIGGDCECKIFLKSKGAKDMGSYHPKFYLFYNDTSYSAIIGSSNFTNGGISKNIESNVSISGNQDDFFELLKKEFINLWQLKYSVNLLDNFYLIDEYNGLLESATKENNKVVDKLKQLRSKLIEKADEILESKEATSNENFAYLLGLIAANSSFDLPNRKLHIFLQRGLINKGTEHEGFYTYPEISNYSIRQVDAHSRDIEKITDRILDLLISISPNDDIDYVHVKDLNFEIILKFSQNSFLLKEILKFKFNTDGTHVVPKIPSYILKNTDPTIIKAFIRGYCDLKSRITASDGIYSVVGNKKKFSSLRMGISVSHNSPKFMNDFVKLLHKIGIGKGVSATDPEKRTKELLIRIGVRDVPYDLLGTHWKRIFLKDFQFYLNSNNRKYDPNQIGLF